MAMEGNQSMLHRALYLHPLEENYVSRSFPMALWAWLGMMVVFHSLCAVLEIFDRTQSLKRFRTLPAGDFLTYFEMLPRVLFNQVCLMLPAMLLVEHCGLAFHNRQVFNSLPSFIACMAVMGIGHDVIFYFGHRYLLHSRWGYKLFGHNLHHSTRANCAISAFYMAPADFCFEILLPYLIPLISLGNEACVVFSVMAPGLGSIGGLYEHSGYNFVPSIEPLNTTAHFMHHKLGFVSFSDGVGSPNMMDNLFQTTHAHYLKSKESAKQAAVG